MVVASLVTSLVVTGVLALSLTPSGRGVLRGLAAVAGSRIFPWAPVSALADAGCQPPSTSGGGTPPPNTSGGGTPPPNTSGGGTPPPNTSGGGTPPPNTSGGGTPPPNTSAGGTCGPPAVVINPSSPALCLGGSVTLTAIASGGALPETFSWSPSTGLSATSGPMVTASPTITTNYTVTLTDSTGATASANTTVAVNPLPTVTISGTPAGAIVFGTTVSLTGVGSGGSGSYTYAWTKSGAPFASGATVTDAPGAGDTFYGVTATDTNGCTASASATVAVYDYTISFSPADETVLAGTPATYTATLTLVGDATGAAPSSVSLTITGMPAGATVSAPASLALTGPGTMGTVTVSTALTPLGDFTLLASGSVGGQTRTSSPAGLHIYDFTLAVAPPTQTVTLGGSPAAYTISASLPLPGSTAVGLPSSVGLSVTGLPATVAPTFPSSVMFGASVPLSLAIGSTSPGDYPFTVTGAVPGGGRSAASDLKIAYNICVQYDQTQVKKAGSTIPIKLQLCDANGANVSAPNIVVHATYLMLVSGIVPPVTPDDSGNANPDSDFRFDGTIGTTGGYIFNLSTKGLFAGAWTLHFMAGADPTDHSVGFLLR